MSDEAEIRRLLYRYARAVDTKDWELYRSVFTDDAHVDYSAAGFVVGTAEDGVDFFRKQLADVTVSMHYVTNIEADVDATGKTARVVAMWYNAVQLPGASETSFFGGRWHHEMVRTPEGWRSRMLRLEVQW